MTRVFVSSTCYDLLDLRAEVEAHLRSLDLLPVLSDRATSEFEVSGRKNSIEECLEQVSASDVFVLILDRRYGPSLARSGYADKSATHLEYERARDLDKPILVFVRNQTVGELNTLLKRRKSKHKNAARGETDATDCGDLQWVRQDQALRLAEFYAEVKRLGPKDQSNWFWPFRDSVELKQQLKKALARYHAGAQLQKLSEAGQLPALLVYVRKSQVGDPPIEWQWTVKVKNFGAAPALDVQVEVDSAWRHMDVAGLSHAETGTVTVKKMPRDSYRRSTVSVKYVTVHGHAIIDAFEIRGQSTPAKLEARWLSSESAWKLEAAEDG